MKILFETHSIFSDLCEKAILADRQALSSGQTIKVMLEPGGDYANVTVTIPALEATVFMTDWQGSDYTHFPTRVQAAATALRDCGFTGNFMISHRNGLLFLRKIHLDHGSGDKAEGVK